MDYGYNGLDCVQAYLDDILIKSETRHQHVEDIKIVFERIKEYEFRIKYLGQVIKRVDFQILPDQAQLKTCPLLPFDKIASLFRVYKLLPCVYTKYA